MRSIRSRASPGPFGGKKKGADSGIDGLIHFQDDEKLPKKVVVGVKGGEGVSVAMLRDFGHVITREKAALGLFVDDPTFASVTLTAKTLAVIVKVPRELAADSINLADARRVQHVRHRLR
jgi:hypothetical protein